MKTIYIHPKGSLCSQETDFPWLKPFVPLSRDNIQKVFKVKESINFVDFIYLGQVKEGDTTSNEFVDLCSLFPKKVIVDLEGDFGTTPFHSCYTKVITCASGPDKKWNLENCFVRPPLSPTLVDLYNSNPSIIPTESKNAKLFFQGQFNVPNRIIMLQALKQLNSNFYSVVYVPQWGGNLQPNANNNYANNMNAHLLSLCPKGVGGSSIRFYESCYFGMVPIILGNDKVMGEDSVDTSFIYRIEDYTNLSSVISKLNFIMSEPKETLISKGKAARCYYDTVVKPYMDNPIKSFTDWMHNAK